MEISNIRKSIYDNYLKNKCRKCNGIILGQNVGNIHYRCLYGYGHYCRFPIDETEIVNKWLFEYGVDINTIQGLISECKITKLETLTEFIRIFCLFRNFSAFSWEKIVRVYLIYNQIHAISKWEIDEILVENIDNLDVFEEKVKLKVEEKLNTMFDLWIMERYEYDNSTQWLPREMLEDIISLI